MENEQTYFDAAIKRKKTRYPIFYGLMKIHKGPEKTRPVTSVCGSVLEPLSTWLDFVLQPLTEFIPSYTKDWTDIKTRLSNLGQLPTRAKLFVSDAVSMYTNIDTAHGIAVMEKWLNQLEREKKTNDFPIKLVIEALEIIMTNNYFQFGDTYWLQLSGTAMGTPVACIYATVYFAYKEMNDIIPKFKSNLLEYIRYIDDVAGVWTGGDGQEWTEFKQEMNNFLPGHLQWETSDLATNT